METPLNTDPCRDPVGTAADSLQLPDCDNAYLKFQIVAGEDWQPLDGLEDGITQASRASQGQGHRGRGWRGPRGAYVKGAGIKGQEVREKGEDGRGTCWDHVSM